MGWIVDRIVGVDAPEATLAQQASIEMLEARRNERNYLLLRDQGYLQANAQALVTMKQTLSEVGSLEAEERAIDAIAVYQQRLAEAVFALRKPGQEPAERIEGVVRAYEEDLDDLLRGARHRSREKLIDELRNRVGSFDAQITNTVQEGNPTLRQVTADLQTSSRDILQITSELETRNWKKVQDDHQNARQLLYRAERVLAIVSGLTLFLSIWISFILPRQVIKPLVSLREKPWMKQPPEIVKLNSRFKEMAKWRN